MWWLQGVLQGVGALVILWHLTSHAPFDIVLRALRRYGWETLRAPALEPALETDVEADDQHDNSFKSSQSTHSPAHIPELASDSSSTIVSMHPRHKLLAIFTPSVTSNGLLTVPLMIDLYDAETSRILTKVKIPVKGFPHKSLPSISRGLTCMQFSNANHLALGRSDGSVSLLTLARELISRDPRPQFPADEAVLNTRQVALLGVSGKFQSKLLGSVRHIQFSPDVHEHQLSTLWMAVSTECSGVWVWNSSSDRAMRIIPCGDAGVECMRWVFEAKSTMPIMGTQYQPKIPDQSGIWGWAPVKEPMSLSQSTTRRFSNAFGELEIMIDLNDYYLPKESTLNVPQSSGRRRKAISSVNVKDLPRGYSLLATGFKDGKISIKRIFHSKSMLRIEAGFEFFAPQVVRHLQSPDDPYRSFIGIIKDLVLIPQDNSQVGGHPTNFHLLVTTLADGTSRLHKFRIAVPPNTVETKSITGPSNWVAQLIDNSFAFLKKSSIAVKNNTLSQNHHRSWYTGYSIGDWDQPGGLKPVVDYGGSMWVRKWEERHWDVERFKRYRIISMDVDPSGTRVIVGVVREGGRQNAYCLIFDADDLDMSAKYPSMALLDIRQPSSAMKLPLHKATSVGSKAFAREFSQPRITGHRVLRIDSSGFDPRRPDGKYSGAHVAFGWTREEGTIAVYGFWPESPLQSMPVFGIFPVNF